MTPASQQTSSTTLWIARSAASGADDANAASGPEPSSADEPESERRKVYGDAAYGTGEFLNHLEKEGIDSVCKTQSPNNRDGLFPKSRFQGRPRHRHRDLSSRAHRPDPPHCGRRGDRWLCSAPAPIVRCDPSAPSPHVAAASELALMKSTSPMLAHRQQDPDWAADYRANRPKVERKIAHLMRRRHGGRRARVRGQTKVDADFNLLAAAQNLARLAVLGIQWTALGWVAGTALERRERPGETGFSLQKIQLDRKAP